MNNRHMLAIGLGAGAANGAGHAWLMQLNPTMSAVAGILTFILIFGLYMAYVKLSKSVV